MAPKSKSATPGGIKGFFTRAGKSFKTGGLFAKDQSHWIATKLFRFGFIAVTTTMVTFLPLVFEIAREGQMIEAEKLQIKELRNQGFSDPQLREMGYCEPSIARAPSVVGKNV